MKKTDMGFEHFAEDHQPACKCGCDEPVCWLVFGRTKSGFCELLAVCTDEGAARRTAEYVMLPEQSGRILQTIVEPREMNHALGQSMLGIGKLPRTFGQGREGFD